MEAADDRLDGDTRKLGGGGIDDVEDATVRAAGEHDHPVVLVHHHHQLVVERIGNEATI